MPDVCTANEGAVVLSAGTASFACATGAGRYCMPGVFDAEDAVDDFVLRAAGCAGAANVVRCGIADVTAGLGLISSGWGALPSPDRCMVASDEDAEVLTTCFGTVPDEVTGADILAPGTNPCGDPDCLLAAAILGLGVDVL